jgi:hypothetical protein
MDSREPDQKEGFQTTVDFVKLLITLSSGAIAFVIQPAFEDGSYVFEILQLLRLFVLYHV